MSPGPSRPWAAADSLTAWISNARSLLDVLPVPSHFTIKSNSRCPARHGSRIHAANAHGAPENAGVGERTIGYKRGLVKSHFKTGFSKDDAGPV